MRKVWESARRFYASSIGKKIIVALTGLALLGFIFGHMVGNLLVFQGPDALNSYAHFLKTAGHGNLVWLARGGLLAAFVVHIIATIQLTVQNREARVEAYAKVATVQASRASRTMIVSGLIILCFVVYHLLHFTFGLANDYLSYKEVIDGHPRQDVYRMVVEGFSWWPASAFYIFAMGLLCFHLSHGFASVFQTLGLRTKKTWPVIRGAGYIYAAVIFLGNCSIPLSILTGLVSSK